MRRWRGRPRWVRWSAYVAAVVVLALVGGVVVGVTAVRRSLPQTSGTLDVPGLDGEVTVVRDAAGVPQVYAGTAHDLFLAQGYVQAQDRFFQMDVRRHRAAGRLSELFGRQTIDEDKLVRTMGWRRVAQDELARLRPETARYLDAFSAGVNAYLADRSPADLSVEYTLLGLEGLDYRADQWTAVDSLAWLKAMAWAARGNLQDEVDRATLSARLEESQIAELYPRYGSGSGLSGNAWAVDGAHSTTGRPILAADPHGTPELPGEWYQMGLHCTEVTSDCPFDVAGLTSPGFPGVLTGHNPTVAWAYADSGADVADLYLEAVDGERYLRSRHRPSPKWRSFDRRQETIRIRGEEPFTFTVRTSVHGPLVSDVSKSFATVGANAPVPVRSWDAHAVRGTGYAVALSWAGSTPTRTADAVFALDRASDWTQFQAAARRYALPAQFVYADAQGHVGFQETGRIPVRSDDQSGLDASPGWDRSYDWTGRWVRFRALPSSADPAGGFVVAPGDLGPRSARIADVLARKGTLGVADCQQLQLDTRSAFASTLVPYLLEVTPGGPYYSAGQRLLKEWDFSQPADSAAAAYYNAVWRNLLRDTFADQLPESVGIDGSGRWAAVVGRLLSTPNSPWWDDVTTETVREGRDDMLRQALRDARDELVRLQSRGVDGWTWGHQHVLRLQNRLGGDGLAGALLDRDGWQLGGGSESVLATGWDAEDGYAVTSLPSARLVMSLADLDDSSWVTATGASGHAFADHYTDQTDLWTAGGTHSWSFTRSAVEDAAEQTLTLRPGPGLPTGPAPTE